MLLVFITGMAFARPVLLLVGTLSLILLYLLMDTLSPGNALTMVKRLRWLFLAILIVYGWWTPGERLLPAAGNWSPTLAGLQLGLIRVLALIAIVAAVQLLLQCTRREQLLPAIMQLVRPFTSRQLRERFAVRTLLAIEFVPRVQTMAATIHAQQPASTNRIGKLATSSRQLYQEVLEQIHQAGSSTIAVNELSVPAWWQWLLPAAMSTIIVLAL